MKQCPIQEVCQHYSNGSKRKSHYARVSNPCKSFLDMSCEMGMALTRWIDGEDAIACDIGKIRGIKAKIEKEGK